MVHRLKTNYSKTILVVTGVLFMATVISGLSSRVIVAQGLPPHEEAVDRDHQSSGTGQIADGGYTLVFGGDVMLARNVGAYIKYNNLNPFRDITNILTAADLAVVNLECVVSDTGSATGGKKYTFRAEPEVLELVKSAGIDVVSVANNHAGDYGRVAFLDMLSRLDAAGIGYFGGGTNITRAYAPQVVLVDDLRVALIGVSNIETPYFAATDTQAGIAWVDDARITTAIEKARTLADIVVVIPHWGWEYTQIVSSEQQRLAHLMIDAGADAVIGSHPHHIQQTEEYQGKIIAYSMGNLVFEGIGPNPGWSLGELIQLEIGRDKQVEEVKKIPYRISAEGVATPL